MEAAAFSLSAVDHGLDDSAIASISFIYEVLPEILELWGSNLVTDVASKKNSSAAAVK